MIVQGLMNYFAQVMAAFMTLIPPLPGEWQDMLTKIGDGGAYLGGKVSLLSPIVPFDAFNGVINAFSGIVAFWALMMGVRAILWAVGR